MKRLLKYFKGYGKECVLGPLFKLLEASLELLVPVIVAFLIDNAIPASDKSLALKLCLLLALLGLIGLGFSVTAQWFAAKAATGFAARVKAALFDRISSFSVAQAEAFGAPTLLTRLTGDMNQVQTGVNLTLRLLLRSPFVVFGAMICAFAVDSKEALLFAGLIPALAVVVIAVMLISIPLYRKVQNKLDTLLSHTRDNLTGVRVLRAFRRERAETASFDEKNASLTREQRFVGRISALLNPLTYVILNFAVILLLSTGGKRIDRGTLTTGQLVALYNYMSQILVELIKLADLILNITRALASASRVAAVLDAPADDIPEGGGELAGGSVAFDHVFFRYPSASGYALSDVTFSVPAGKKVGIIGSTGSGKSTLVNLIPRLFEATEGTVSVGGTPVNSLPLGTLRRAVSVVPQKLDLFEGSIRENLQAGLDLSDDVLLAAADAAQAADVLAEKGGLDGLLEPAGRDLSGGQKQRLAIARALARSPRILILDDSSSALDAATDAALREALAVYAKDCTVFTVSQRTSSLASCDFILVLEEGKVVGEGRHEELLESCPVYREIYDSQNN